jgi:hypothetical protein
LLSEQATPRHSKYAAGENPWRECAPDNGLRDSHHVPDDRDGFREALDRSDRLPAGLSDLPVGSRILFPNSLSSPF